MRLSLALKLSNTHHCTTCLHVKIGSFVVLMVVLSGSDPIFTDLIVDVHTIQTLAIFSLGVQSVKMPRLLVLCQAANRESEHQSSTKGAAVTTSYPGVTSARETDRRSWEECKRHINVLG